MRTKDRLAELRQASPAPAEPPRAPPAAPPHLLHIHELLHEVERAHGWMSELSEQTQLLRRLHADPTFHTNKPLQERLDAVSAASGELGARVCGALRALDARAAGADSACGARIARLQLAAARSRFAGVLRARHAALGGVRDARRALLAEQLALTGLAADAAERDALLDAPELALFAGDVRAQTAEARRALRDAEGRHAELARVEAALGEVRDLFAQLGALVAAQQDAVDSVEYYALRATDHVDSGHHHLLKGSVSRAKSTRKKMGLVLCLLAGVSVVLLVLLLT